MAFQNWQKSNQVKRLSIKPTIALSPSRTKTDFTAVVKSFEQDGMENSFGNYETENGASQASSINVTDTKASSDVSVHSSVSPSLNRIGPKRNDGTIASETASSTTSENTYYQSREAVDSPKALYVSTHSVKNDGPAKFQNLQSPSGNQTAALPTTITVPPKQQLQSSTNEATTPQTTIPMPPTPSNVSTNSFGLPRNSSTVAKPNMSKGSFSTANFSVSPNSTSSSYAKTTNPSSASRATSKKFGKYASPFVSANKSLSTASLVVPPKLASNPFYSSKSQESSKIPKNTLSPFPSRTKSTATTVTNPLNVTVKTSASSPSPSPNATVACPFPAIIVPKANGIIQSTTENVVANMGLTIPSASAIPHPFLPSNNKAAVSLNAGVDISSNKTLPSTTLSVDATMKNTSSTYLVAPKRSSGPLLGDLKTDKTETTTNRTSLFPAAELASSNFSTSSKDIIPPIGSMNNTSPSPLATDADTAQYSYASLAFLSSKKNVSASVATATTSLSYASLDYGGSSSKNDTKARSTGSQPTSALLADDPSKPEDKVEMSQPFVTKLRDVSEKEKEAFKDQSIVKSPPETIAEIPSKELQDPYSTIPAPSDTIKMDDAVDLETKNKKATILFSERPSSETVVTSSASQGPRLDSVSEPFFPLIPSPLVNFDQGRVLDVSSISTPDVRSSYEIDDDEIESRTNPPKSNTKSARDSKPITIHELWEITGSKMTDTTFSKEINDRPDAHMEHDVDAVANGIDAEFVTTPRPDRTSEGGDDNTITETDNAFLKLEDFEEMEPSNPLEDRSIIFDTTEDDLIEGDDDVDGYYGVPENLYETEDDEKDLEEFNFAFAPRMEDEEYYDDEYNEDGALDDEEYYWEEDRYGNEQEFKGFNDDYYQDEEPMMNRYDDEDEYQDFEDEEEDIDGEVVDPFVVSDPPQAPENFGAAVAAAAMAKTGGPIPDTAFMPPDVQKQLSQNPVINIVSSPCTRQSPLNNNDVESLSRPNEYEGSVVTGNMMRPRIKKTTPSQSQSIDTKTFSSEGAGNQRSSSVLKQQRNFAISGDVPPTFGSAVAKAAAGLGDSFDSPTKEGTEGVDMIDDAAMKFYSRTWKRPPQV